MPVTKETISSLKRTNISADEEKTKSRVKDDFLALRNKQKTAIVELTGLKRTSIYRVFREGNISAKIVLAMAQVLNVSPYYYTGESDEKGEFNDSVLAGFLANKGYTKQAEHVSVNKAAAPAAASAPAPAAPASAKPRGFALDFTNSVELGETAGQLEVEEAVQLLRALFIRAKAGGNAAQIADVVKRCLLV
ncbi:MAG: hypothetical protein LBR72_05955 [Oscillospiraceae bacterium]|jgi:hypothetical protein|nr:hypothetical protein [Oscillospiraceae bacterium]